MDSIFGLVGRSGSGKTTLIEALLTPFGAQGLRVNVIKHSHHDVQFEPPCKDSARFRTVGAAEVLLATPYRFAVFHELHDKPEPTLEQQPALRPLLGRFWPLNRKFSKNEAGPMVTSPLTNHRQHAGVWTEGLSADAVFRVAVNQEISSIDTPVHTGEEIAISQPMTGG